MKVLAADDPRVIGEFRVRLLLGEGGMGRVYLGLSPAGRAVAIKVLHPDLARNTEFLCRFETEIASARAVSGIYTAPVVATGLDDRPPWLATAFVPGPSLREVVCEEGPLSETAIWPLFAGLVEALQAIHACEVVHRDLKPSNVLLAADGPRVIDFGISRAGDATALTATGMVFGSPGYMSPEQAEGKPTGPVADIFSLGCLMTFAAAAAPPFGEGNAASVLYRVVHADPDLDALPPGLREIVSRCLDKSPAERPTLPSLAASIARELRQISPPALSFWPPPVAGLIGRYQTALEAEWASDPEVAAEPADDADSVTAQRTLTIRDPSSLEVRPYLPGAMLAAIRLMYAGASYAPVFALGSWLIAIAYSGHPLVVWPGHWSIRPLAGLVALAGFDCGIQITFWLGMAWACRNGKTWARAISTLLFACYTIGLIYAVVWHTRDGADTLGTALFGVTWLIGAAAVALLWQRRSSAFLAWRPTAPRWDDPVREEAPQLVR